LTELTSTAEDEEDGAPLAVGSPLSVGAAGSADVAPVVGAGVGVEDAVVVDSCGSELGFDLLSDIIVCTAYAIASASTTPRPIAIFFCFSAFALAASAGFFRATFLSSRAD
jgi:hypothetical protein